MKDTHRIMCSPEYKYFGGGCLASGECFSESSVSSLFPPRSIFVRLKLDLLSRRVNKKGLIYPSSTGCPPRGWMGGGRRGPGGSPRRPRGPAPNPRAHGPVPLASLSPSLFSGLSGFQTAAHVPVPLLPLPIRVLAPTF